MKRIAAHIGLTSFCVLAVAFYLPQNITIAVLAIAGVCAVLFLIIKKCRMTVVLPLTAIVIALSCGVNLVYTALAVKPVIQQFCGEKKQIEATLTDEAYRQYAKYYYRLETDRIDGVDAKVKILLKTDSPIEIEPFDTLRFTADISPTTNDYYKAKGYYITVDALDLKFDVKHADSRPLYCHVIALRQAMRDAIEEYLPEDEANLSKAILIGDKYALDSSVMENFRMSGASYFVVVSGMHFSVIICISLWLFRKLLRRRWLYFPLTYLMIILYMLITGMQPSVMRSGVMMLILVTGQLLYRQSDPLTSLGVAGLLMPLIFSPYGCGDMGMILSFAATFSIIMWQDPIYQKICIKNVEKNRIKRGINVVLSIVSVSLAANILVLPLSVFLFNGFSLMTLLSALLLYPLIWLTMVLSLFVCVFCYLGPLRYLSLLLSWLLYGVIKLILWLVGTIAAIPFAYIHVKSLYVYIWVALTLALGLLAYFLRQRYRLYPYVILLSAIVFFGGLTVNTIIQLNVNQLEVYAGEAGATVYLNRSGRIHLLRFDCDSNSAYQMLYQLTDRYGGAQSAVCTSYQERVNYSRMSDQEFPVKHYLMYDNLSKVYTADAPEISFVGNSVFVLDDGIVLHTIENNGKMLLYLTDGDSSVMLIPSGFAYDAIPESMRSADVIYMNRTLVDYDKLSCDILIQINTSTAKKKLALPKHDTLCDFSQKSVILDMN